RAPTGHPESRSARQSTDWRQSSGMPRWPHDDPRRRRRSALQLSLTATRAEDEVIVGKGRCRAHGVLLDEQTGVDHGDESTGTKKAPPPVILSGEGLPLRCATRDSNPQPSDP